MTTLSTLWADVGFNPYAAQEQAILHIDGPLYLPAGPGSGKTRVLLWRVVNLIVYHGVKPDEIFLATLTEKAALQLKEGLRGLLAVTSRHTGQHYDLGGIHVGTVNEIKQVLADHLTENLSFVAAETAAAHDLEDLYPPVQVFIRAKFLLGAHCPGVTSDTNLFQLYGRELTPEKLIEFITQCSKPNKQTLLFCHGPDFGHIEKRFGINLKDQYPCINVITAYKRFTRFQCKSLGHLAHTLQLGKWRNPIPTGRVGALWKTRTATDRRQVLDYNWDDCVILGNAVSHLRQGRRPAVKSKDFIDSARL